MLHGDHYGVDGEPGVGIHEGRVWLQTLDLLKHGSSIGSGGFGPKMEH